MKRRKFIAGLGAVAWPFAAHSQQPAIPVIGFIGAEPPDMAGGTVAGMLRGLLEAGYVEGRNLAVEYRWAEYRLERMLDLANDLVLRKVAVIVVLSTPAASAAKAAVNSNRFWDWLQPGRGLLCCESQPTRRQPYGRFQPPWCCGCQAPPIAS